MGWLLTLTACIAAKDRAVFDGPLATLLGAEATVKILSGKSIEVNSLLPDSMRPSGGLSRRPFQGIGISNGGESRG